MIIATGVVSLGGRLETGECQSHGRVSGCGIFWVTFWLANSPTGKIEGSTFWLFGVFSAGSLMMDPPQVLMLGAGFLHFFADFFA